MASEQDGRHGRDGLGGGVASTSEETEVEDDDRVDLASDKLPSENDRRLLDYLLRKAIEACIHDSRAETSRSTRATPRTGRAKPA